MSKIKELENNGAFCVMPFAHLHIDTSGNVQACCVSDNTKHFGNINQSSLDEIWNSESINEFRKMLINGEKSDRCKYCYNLEKNGIKSLRQHSNENYKTREDLIKNPKPIYWDIRFSNKCNFKCRTCWHGASSNWFEDSKKLKENVGDKAIINAVDDVPKLFKELEKYKFLLKELYFAGGEPLLMDEHYTILNHLISIGRTDVSLRYNTNMSVRRYKDNDIVHIWKEFNDVNVHMSIDAQGRYGEIIRKGQNWGDTISNIRDIKRLAPNVKFKLACTVSALNIFEIPDLYRSFVEDNEFIKPHEFYLNFVTTPEYYSIQMFPQKMKMKIKEIYQEIYREFPMAIWLELIQFMNNDDKSHLIEKFLFETKRLDNIRNENIMNTIEELKELNDYV